MPTPLPPKGTVLQTAEFADSLYSPIKWLVVVEISATLFQPARSGSHLIFRTPTPRAVEDFIVKVLLASRGACHSASALHPSFVS